MGYQRLPAPKVIEWVGRTTSDLYERPPGRVIESFLVWLPHGKGSPSVVIAGRGREVER